MKKLIKWYVNEMKTNTQWRFMTIFFVCIFGAIEIGIQLIDKTFPSMPYHFLYAVGFYVLFYIPLGYLMRNNH